MLALLTTLALAQDTPEWRGALGSQVDADPHGIVDLGWRQGSWSVELLTDTVDARWSPSWERGRGWLGLRGQGYAGQMLISPWEDGAPAPERALVGLYGGVDGGAVTYLPAGLYVGAAGAVRLWGFGRRGAASTAPVPAPRPVGSAEAIVGWWRESAELAIRAGADISPLGPAPRVWSRFELRPPWVVAPWVLAHGIAAEGQDDLLTARVGGLNPYVIPVAGAAWAEWWVEDVAALRGGPRLQGELGSLAVVGDVAWFERSTVAGLGIVSRWTPTPWFIELSVGYAPWIPRQADVGRSSLFVLIGRSWAPRLDE